MNWGRSIVLVFIGFAIFIGVLVTVCVKQNISLVSKDYYAEELNYQKEIDELKNYASMSEKPVLTIHNKQIGIWGIKQGELKLFRPSDARFDAKFNIDATNSFNLSEYPSGKYNVTVRWQADGKSYQMRESITL